jgi:DNA-binding MarR family transcriptional regulator
LHDLGSARAADLSEYFGIDKGALSRQLSLLEDLRLITR